jgi:signal transduction histidine kinase
MRTITTQASATRRTAVPPRRRPAGSGIRGVCHDLRQPIAAILILADIAAGQPELCPETRAVVEMIADQAGELTDLVGELLGPLPEGRSDHRSEYPSGRGEPDAAEAVEAAQRIDVGALIASVAARWRITYDGALAVDDRGLERYRGRTRPRVGVSGNPVALQRVLAILLSNATRAAGSHGTVLVGCTVRVGETRRGDGAHGIGRSGQADDTEAVAVEMTVEDSGPGFGCVPSEYGIGLLMADRIAREHGGSLEFGGHLDGTGRLGGAVVRLTLPAAAPLGLVAVSGPGPVPGPVAVPGRSRVPARVPVAPAMVRSVGSRRDE